MISSEVFRAVSKQMASLPAGWAADYDGKRWFFRHEATSHVQYHFPKPGDEFPDFAGFFGGGGEGAASNEGLAKFLVPAELLPEERLESERQLRRRETLERDGRGGEGGRGGGGAGNEQSRWSEREREYQREEEQQGGLEDEDDFDFDSFGFLGPCAHSEIAIAPLSDRQRNISTGIAPESVVSVAPVSSLTTTPAASMILSSGSPPASSRGEEAGARAVELINRPHRPAPPPDIPAFELSSQVVTDVRRKPVPTMTARQFVPDVVPMLDGKEVSPSPVGRMAELVSESTARCREEMSPTPVELPDTGASWLEPVPVPNLINQYPVELPALETDIRSSRSDDSREKSQGEGPMRGVRIDERQWQQARGRQPGLVREYAKDDVDRRKSFECRPTSSAEAELQSPPRPPKIRSRSGQPSPKPAAEILDEDRLEQEILDFFSADKDTPDHSTIPRFLRPGAATTTAPAVRPGMDARRLTVPPPGAKLGPVPSILRPGPRRSSQPARPEPSTWAEPKQHDQRPIPLALRPGSQANARWADKPYHQRQPPDPSSHARTGPGDAADERSQGPRAQGPSSSRPQSMSPYASRTQSSPEVQRPQSMFFTAPRDYTTSTNNGRIVMPEPDEHMRAVRRSRGTSMLLPAELQPQPWQQHQQVSSSTFPPRHDTTMTTGVTMPHTRDSGMPAGVVRMPSAPLVSTGGSHSWQHHHDRGYQPPRASTGPSTAFFPHREAMTSAVPPGREHEPYSGGREALKPDKEVSWRASWSPSGRPFVPNDQSRRTSRRADTGDSGGSGTMRGDHHVEDSRIGLNAPMIRREEVAEWSWGHAG